MNIQKLIYATTSSLVVILLNSATSYAAISDHLAVPVTIIDGADPNVLINLSIETPMQGSGYNDGDNTASGGSCTGQISVSSKPVGICYFPTKEYIGYFNPKKCYDYNTTTDYFEPDNDASATHTCSGEWSGNFLNWATMTATDEFRLALNGGTRYTDTTTETVLERSSMGLGTGSSWFPQKRLQDGGVDGNVAPSTVTPYSDTTLYFKNHGYQVDVGTTVTGSEKVANLYVRVKVCDSSEGLEDNCVAYGSNHKPEGLIQKNASFMRFAVMSYLRDNAADRDGGVLRTNMKYVGPNMPNPLGGIMPNPNKEWDGTTGIQLSITDPDGLAALDGDINFSGAINYINGFGRNGYKGRDPIGELFYECINYYKKRGPTAEYSTGLTAAMKDNFPVINGSTYQADNPISGNNNWNDPILHRCQNNYIVGINDANPWFDKKLPGSTWTQAQVEAVTSNPDTVNKTGSDWGEPSNPDTDYNTTTWTNTVGDLQGITGTSRCIGGTATTFTNTADNEVITELGNVMGSCGYTAKQNSYGIAGLAYYANTQDIRSDIPEKQTIKTFLIDTQEYNANPLTGEMNMLWLAGKYGGFTESADTSTDTNGDGNFEEPDLVSEWDQDGDGEPDNYVLATDPSKLVAGLNRAFSGIERRQSAGAAAAVISNTTSSTSNVIQALYQPRKFSNVSEVRWVGKLHSIWIDEKGDLREDLGPGNVPNAKLDSSYAVDPKIKLLYTPSVERTQVYYCTGSPCTAESEFSIKEVDELKPVWDAEKILSSLSNASIDNQRTYTAAVDPGSNSNGRYIFTWMDDGASSNADNGVVNTDEFTAFTASAITNSNYGYLNILQSNDGNGTVTASDADNIVDFIRGKEGVSTSFRSRTLNSRVHRLGDIIHSSPLAVAEPNSKWDDDFADPTYTAFRLQYSKRRQVVYVGANDGMLHAFNAGFFNPVSKQYNLKNTSGSETEHVLGAELWAYVPKNLLPHLQWLADPKYPHVYYVDGSIQTFDVNIFPKTGDTVHPGGWGTILVTTMRFGGNPITYDHDGNGGTADITARSAIIIMDVTDPESPPKLLAEFTHASLGFTTSTPDLIVKRTPDDAGDWSNAGTSTFPNDWYLVFGSGPNQLAGSTTGKEAISTQDYTAYLLKLSLSGTSPNQYLDTSSNLDTLPSTVNLSFMGDPLVVDWNEDFQSDAVYFGTVTDTVAEPGGKLMRWRLSGTTSSSWAVAGELSEVVSPSVTTGIAGQPFSTKPFAVLDKSGSRTHWIFAGTGRLYVKDDNLSQTQHSYYGVKERLDSDSVPTAFTANRSGGSPADLLQDVTDVFVEPGGAVTTAGNLPGGTTTFNQIQALITGGTRAGWFVDFENTPTDPFNERTLSGTAFSKDLLFYTTYRPPTDICTAVGQGRLYGLYYKTGTKHPLGGLRVQACDFCPLTGDFQPYVELGQVQAFTPIVNNDNMLITKDDGSFQNPEPTGIPIDSGRQSWREIILDY